MKFLSNRILNDSEVININISEVTLSEMEWSMVKYALARQQ